jgi:hypothetical protein
MANTDGMGTMWNLPNYVGELFLIGANQTPFLNMIGGLTGGKQYAAFDFPTAQPWALNSATQPAIDEDAAADAPKATTYVRGQDTNTVQIFHQAVNVSYAKQSTSRVIAADVTTGDAMLGNQPVNDELDFQIQGNLRQISLDAEYSFLQGTYQQATNANTAAKTRGIITATTTNAVNASSAELSKDLIDELLRDMASNGSVFVNPVIFCNAFQKQKISSIYGYAPESRNVGGVNISQIETDFAMLGVVWAPQMPTSTLLIAEMSVCSPVFCPVPGKGLLFYEELSRSGAAEKGHIYGQMGLDYGPEEYHGKITSLATS